MQDIARYQNYVDGKWRPAGPDGIEVTNPATGRTAATAPASDAGAVDEAVAAASRAWQSWRWTRPAQRAAHLHRIADIARERTDDLARSITREQGKPLDEARGEVAKFVKTLHFYAEEATRVFGRTIPNEEDGYLSVVEKEPVGVVAGIVPWNYPVELIGWKLAGALAAGCTIVVKPSEHTPGSAHEVFRCLDEAGLPEGVANLVFGDGGTGRALAAQPEIAKVAFTGSRATGEGLYRTVSGITGLTLELGGNCPMLVTGSADLAAAVRGAARRSFRNAGQICIAINRIYVVTPLYDQFVDELARAASELRVDDGLQNPAADVGALTLREVADRTAEHVADAEARGGRVLAGGGPAPDGSGGRFYPPTVVADVPRDARLMHEETFGPAVGVAPVDNVDDAVHCANDTPGGLAAYVYARDLDEVFAASRTADFGNVAVNNVDAGIVNAPYGGRKQSGTGYEHGPEGLESYLHLKHIRLRHGS